MTTTNGTQVFGEVNWADKGGFGNKKENAKDIFLKLDDGDNEVRILTAPFQKLVHRYKVDPNNKKDFGRKVLCSAIHGKCPICSMEGQDKAKQNWLVGVLSRKTGSYKILDISWAVFSQIQKFNDNPKWGDPANYDFNIFVNRNGGATGYYTLMPCPKEPLTAAEMVIKDNVDLDVLKQRTTPWTPEQVEKYVAKINEGGSFNNFGASETPKQKVVVKVAEEPETNSSDDDDEGFPAYSSAE